MALGAVQSNTNAGRDAGETNRSCISGREKLNNKAGKFGEKEILRKNSLKLSHSVFVGRKADFKKIKNKNKNASGFEICCALLFERMPNA